MSAHFAVYRQDKDAFIVVGVTGKGNVVEEKFANVIEAIRAFVLMTVERDDIALSLSRHYASQPA